MTHKPKTRKKHWTAVLHDHGGYALFDENGNVVGRYLDQDMAIHHHAAALQALQRLDEPAIERYPIVYEHAEELSLLATTPFKKPKIAKRKQADG